jgi:hypothetical protein
VRGRGLGSAAAGGRGRGQERREGGLWTQGSRDPAAAAPSGEQLRVEGRNRERGPHHAQSLLGEEEEPGSLSPQLG